MAYEQILFCVYARGRMFYRGVSVDEVIRVLRQEDVIEDYGNGRYLVLGWIGNRGLHVVVDDDHFAQTTTVVTVYEPDSANWKSGFRDRKK